MPDNDNYDETRVESLNDCYFLGDAVFYDAEYEAFYTFERDSATNEVVYHDLAGDPVEELHPDDFKHSQGHLHPVGADAVADPVGHLGDTVGELLQAEVGFDASTMYARHVTTIEFDHDFDPTPAAAHLKAARDHVQSAWDAFDSAKDEETAGEWDATFSDYEDSLGTLALNVEAAEARDNIRPDGWRENDE